MAYSFVNHRLTGYVALVEDDPYWEGLEDGVLQLPRCSGCSRSRWESIGGVLGWPTVRCGNCGTWDMDWVAVPMTGTIYSWGRSNQVFGGMEARRDQIPYVTLDVELDAPEGPRVLGVLKGPADELRVGARVTGSIDPPSVVTKGYAGLRWTLTG